VDNLDAGVMGKPSSIERKNSREAMHLHRGDQPSRHGLFSRRLDTG
jgi:hypothetical protein